MLRMTWRLFPQSWSEQQAPCPDGSMYPQNVDRGLAKLVLTLIELLRRVMEHQAIQRIEGGSLSEEEIERLGQTFMKLAEKMEELKQTFGLSDEDLNLNLGPLGNLL